MTTIVSAQPVPALGEIAILTQRCDYLLAALELCGRSLPEEAHREIERELADIETALQRYDGTMDDIADARREARFGCGL